MTNILTETYLNENLNNYSKSSLIYFPIKRKDKIPKCKWGNITKSVPIQGDNVGLNTGQKSNITVVDIDVKDNGLNKWNELIDKYGKIDNIFFKLYF